MDSQASTYGKHDSWNQHNADESWEHFVPLDPVGTAWRKNSYKKAIAEAGDHVDALIDDFGDEETLFIIAGDHGHVAPGGMGGASDENLLVPLFAYKKGSRLGHDLKKQRRAAGSSPQLDGARFVSRARRIEEIEEKPAVVANDVCDIMAESVGSEHINTCDEWREDGEFTIETVDLAPTVMALLGLPVPRHATGVFIDDLMGSIAPSTPMSTTLGGNCTGEHLAAETRAGARLRLDRMCDGAYAANEDPATAASAAGWSADTYLKWRHTLHYRDLYQQKLAFVRGYLKAQGKLDYWDGTDLPFLAPTATPNQYYAGGEHDFHCRIDFLNDNGSGTEYSAGTSFHERRQVGSQEVCGHGAKWKDTGYLWHGAHWGAGGKESNCFWDAGSGLRSFSFFEQGSGASGGVVGA